MTAMATSRLTTSVMRLMMHLLRQMLTTLLITMKQSREKMNKMRIARGFFRGTTDGTLDEGGSDKDGEPSSSLPGRRCLKRGRFDHLSFECPNGGGKCKPSLPSRGVARQAMNRGKAAKGLSYEGGGLKRNSGSSTDDVHEAHTGRPGDLPDEFGLQLSRGHVRRGAGLIRRPSGCWCYDAGGRR